MIKFLVGFLAVMVLLVAASTVDQYQKTQKMTAEQRVEHSRYSNGRNLRCDQLLATAERIRDTQFNYQQCMLGR